MRDFFRRIVHALEAGEPVELVTVAAASGSTPRGAGAMMAVFPDGSIAGTIGGGNVEYECQRRAGELLKRGGDDLADFRFVQGDAADLGMVCGGDVTVQFQHLPGGDSRSAAVLRDLIGAAGGDRNTWFLRRIQGELFGRMYLYLRLLLMTALDFGRLALLAVLLVCLVRGIRTHRLRKKTGLP